MKKIWKYTNRVCIAFSVLLNVILGGPSNQTLSARMHQRKRDGKLHCTYLIDKIFYWEPEHCLISWSYWKVRYDVKKDESFEENFSIKPIVRSVIDG